MANTSKAANAAPKGLPKRKAAPKAANAAAPVVVDLRKADGTSLVANATGKGGEVAGIAAPAGAMLRLPLWGTRPYGASKGKPALVAGSSVVVAAPYAATFVSTVLSDWPPIGAVEARKGGGLDRRAAAVGRIEGGDDDGKSVVVLFSDAVLDSKTSTGARQVVVDGDARVVAAVVALSNHRVVAAP